MNLLKKVVLLIFIIVLSSCAEYKIDKLSQKKEKQFYSSKGFALIYEDNLYQQKIINRKINNDQVLRTGDSAIIKFKFKFRPEYIINNM